MLMGEWTPLGSTPIKLGLGPANFAGQLAAFASAVCRERADVSAEVVKHRTASSGHEYPADVYVDGRALKKLDGQLEQVQRIVPRYTHLIADAFRPVFGGLNGDSIEGDLPALHKAGIKVALLAHGSEVRHPLHHMARNPFSLFHDAPEGYTEQLLPGAERNRRIAEESGLPVFVTTPTSSSTFRWRPGRRSSSTWTPGPATSPSWSGSGRSCCTPRRPAGPREPTGCCPCWRTWTGAR
ncbi:hypothetical protein Smic_23950 [Streptomyces microflavus]|uniref:Uncharacterized protein n=1 Tax=Streptomyces microflavus TaxID=1919 RepID=A0A7J0CN29_STRMI|nr:hypothetical protein Smic_23950 [Streptomyces microflavus]